LVSNNYFGQVVVTDTDEERLSVILKDLPIQKKLFRVNFGIVTEIETPVL
jgi:hypothetical protein